jgi:hypothetical protein
VLKKIGEEEESFVVELDYERILESRKLIPILSLSKPDIYRTF